MHGSSVRKDSRRNPIVQEYVLPDFSAKSTSGTGYIRSGPNATIPDSFTNGNSETKRTNKAEEDEQVLWMGNERFVGAELLFNPSDIGESVFIRYPPVILAHQQPGLKQMGLPETIADVIGMMPEEVKGLFWSNIGIFGGLGNVDALGERL